MVSLAVTHIHSEGRGGRGDEEDEEQLQGTVGNNFSALLHLLWGDAAEEKLFTA